MRDGATEGTTLCVLGVCVSESASGKGGAPGPAGDYGSSWPARPSGARARAAPGLPRALLPPDKEPGGGFIFLNVRNEKP